MYAQVVSRNSVPNESKAAYFTKERELERGKKQSLSAKIEKKKTKKQKK